MQQREICGLNGYEALADLDSNHDGTVSNTDINFADLKVWTDTNANGISDAGELHSLEDLGIVSFNLNPVGTSTKDHGNTVGLVSSYQTSDGSSHTLADVWFVADKNRATPIAATAPSQPILTVEPTELQQGVTSLVDALASFEHKHVYKIRDAYDPTDGSATLKFGDTAPAASSTTNQLVQALRQFDANGNPVGGPQNTVAGLAATDPNKQTDGAGGVLAMGRA